MKSLHAFMYPALLCCVCLCAGCATTQPGDHGSTRTDGIALEVFVHRGANSMALYKLRRDGTLQFAGGSNALERKFTWSGAMDEPTLTELVQALKMHGWMDGTPAPADTALAADGELSTQEATRIDVRVQSAAGRRRFVIHGSNAGAREILGYLQQSSAARHEAFLDSLPKPSRRGVDD